MLNEQKKITKFMPRRRRKAPLIPILVVEDNADQWLIIRSVLAQCFPEVQPVWVNNLTLAIKHLETNAADATQVPRLILMDLYVPRREDGLVLLEYIKTREFYRKPPVVLLSCSRDEADIAAVYAHSVASYIVKPGSYHEWLNCFYTFRRYWWEIVTLPLRPQA